MTSSLATVTPGSLRRRSWRYWYTSRSPHSPTALARSLATPAFLDRRPNHWGGGGRKFTGVYTVFWGGGWTGSSLVLRNLLEFDKVNIAALHQIQMKITTHTNYPV